MAPGPGDGTILCCRLWAQGTGRARAAEVAAGPGDGTSQGGRRGYGPARAGLAIVANVAPGPSDGTSLCCRLRARVTGRAKAAEEALGPGDRTSQGGRGGHGPARAGLASQRSTKGSGPGRWDEPATHTRLRAPREGTSPRRIRGPGPQERGRAIDAHAALGPKRGDEPSTHGNGPATADRAN